MYEVYKDNEYCTAKPSLAMTKAYIDRYEDEMKKTARRNPPYGYGREWEDNPPRQDDLNRALNTINHTFNMVGKHVTVGGEGGQYNVYVTDTFSDDIIRTWGPISKDAATYIITGMLETIKIVRYE